MARTFRTMLSNSNGKSGHLSLCPILEGRIQSVVVKYVNMWLTVMFVTKLRKVLSLSSVLKIFIASGHLTLSHAFYASVDVII